MAGSLVPKVVTPGVDTQGAFRNVLLANQALRESVNAPGKLLGDYLEKDKKDKEYQEALGFKQREEQRIIDALKKKEDDAAAANSLLSKLYGTKDVVTNQSDIDSAKRLQSLRDKAEDTGLDTLFGKLDAQNERLMNAGKPTPMEESPVIEKTITEKPLLVTDSSGRTNARGGKTVQQQRQELDVNDAIRNLFSTDIPQGGRRARRGAEGASDNKAVETSGSTAAPTQKAQSTAKTATDILNAENKSIMDTFDAVDKVENKKVVIPEAQVKQELKLVDDYERRILGSGLSTAEKISLLKQLEPAKANAEQLNLLYKRGTDQQTVADAKAVGFKGNGVEAAKKYLDKVYNKDKSGNSTDIFKNVQSSFWDIFQDDKDDVVKFVVPYSNYYREKDLKSAVNAATDDGEFDRESFLTMLKMFKPTSALPKQ